MPAAAFESYRVRFINSQSQIYDPDKKDGCCEACTRARNCKMWSIPGAGHYDECELYFDRLEDDVDLLDRSKGVYLGRARSYSYAKQNPNDFPIIRRKLQHLLDLGGEGDKAHRKLAIAPGEVGKIWPVKEPPLKGFPRSGLSMTQYLGCGWSMLSSYENPCHYPSDDLVFGSGIKFRILSEDSVEPTAKRHCNLEDEKFDVSNGRWVRHPYPDGSMCSPMDVDRSPAKFQYHRPFYHGRENATCWHREDLTKVATSCFESGCRFVTNHRWVTNLKRESKFFGMWQQYQCLYVPIGDKEIQRCIEKKKISNIELRGKSLKNVVDGYMAQKLRNIGMAEGVGTRSVYLDTLAMPHVLWHNSLAAYRQVLENGMPNVTEATGSKDEYYWISGFYCTSEREPHTRLDRSLQFSKMAYDILTPKGYKMLNAFDVTAAFTFDSDSQGDGLHISGPSIKVVVDKFFHHLCDGVLLEDS